VELKVSINLLKASTYLDELESHAIPYQGWINMILTSITRRLGIPLASRPYSAFYGWLDEVVHPPLGRKATRIESRSRMVDLGSRLIGIYWLRGR